MAALTKRIWTVPQKHVAVAVLLSLPPWTPSEGSGMFALILMTFQDSVLLVEQAEKENTK